MKQETPKLGTKEFNDLAMEMFGGKPKQENIEGKDPITIDFTNTKQVKMYSEEEVLNIIDNFCETFKVDLILREDFNQWFEQFKNK